MLLHSQARCRPAGGHGLQTRQVHVARPQPAAIRRSVAAHGTADEANVAADVVIVGAGIVGLFAAHELLRHGLSVALLERKGLCAGATGAGQGYLWMAHRTPGSPGWALAARSISLWHRLVDGEEDFRSAVEWQDCGSLLVSTCPAESASLSERQMQLNTVGLRATYLDARRLSEVEPGLALPRGGAGLLVKADTQINGRAAAHVLLEKCRAAPGFTDIMGPEGEVQGLELEAGLGGGHVVRTQGRRVHARKALVLSAGVWTGGMLSAATGDQSWQSVLQPRRGHLLEMPTPAGMPRVVHGMMEMSYTKHYATSPSSPSSSSPPSASTPSSASRTSSTDPVDITFTATTSASGSLLIGSSREFSGWDTEPSAAIVAAILQRSALFLPGLKPAAAEAAVSAAVVGAAAASGSSSSGSGSGNGSSRTSGGGGSGALAGLSVRVGLRPYAVGGLPMIGPVEGAPGLFVAAGHEGSGLCMGPATAQLLSRFIRKHVGAAVSDGGSLDTRSFEALLPEVRRKAAA